MDLSRRGFIVAGLFATATLPLVARPALVTPAVPAIVPDIAPRGLMLEIERSAGSGRFFELSNVFSLGVNDTVDVIDHFDGPLPGLRETWAELEAAASKNYDFVRGWLVDGDVREVRLTYDGYGRVDTFPAFARSCSVSGDQTMSAELRLAGPATRRVSRV